MNSFDPPPVAPEEAKPHIMSEDVSEAYDVRLRPVQVTLLHFCNLWVPLWGLGDFFVVSVNGFAHLLG